MTGAGFSLSNIQTLRLETEEGIGGKVLIREIRWFLTSPFSMRGGGARHGAWVPDVPGNVSLRASFFR